MALGVALLMLAVLLLLGLGAIRLVTGQERMAGHAQDRALALQAAEAALREAEDLLDRIQPQPVEGDCIDPAVPDPVANSAVPVARVRVCPPAAAASTPRWLDPGFTQWAPASPVGPPGQAITPRYFTEFLGNEFPCGDHSGAPRNCLRYRITAIAGGGGRAQVTLQSIYAPL